MHQQVGLEQIQVREQPVLEHNYIVGRAVVVTADQPLGIWHVDGLELAPFVQTLQKQGLEVALQSYEPQQQRILQQWLATTLNPIS